MAVSAENRSADGDRGDAAVPTPIKPERIARSAVWNIQADLDRSFAGAGGNNPRSSLGRTPEQRTINGGTGDCAAGTGKLARAGGRPAVDIANDGKPGGIAGKDDWTAAGAPELPRSDVPPSCDAGKGAGRPLTTPELSPELPRISPLMVNDAHIAGAEDLAAVVAASAGKRSTPTLWAAIAPGESLNRTGESCLRRRRYRGRS